MGSAGVLASLPALVLGSIWSRLSYAARRSLRATSRALRHRIDGELLRTAIVTTYGIAGSQSSGQGCTPLQLPAEVCRLLESASSGADCNRLDLVQTARNRPDAADVACGKATAARQRNSAAIATAGGDGGDGGNGRFRNLRALVIASHHGGGSSGGLFAALQPFLRPPPATLLAPFTASSSSLTHLALLDPLPGPSERDIAAIAAAFPGLVSLQLLTSPGAAGACAVAAPPLGALCACARLRSLGLDLGRSSILGAGCRNSLGLLTQLTQLMLGLADTGGDELEAAAAAVAAAPGCCSCCGGGGGGTQPKHCHRNYYHHHHHQLYRGCCLAYENGAAAAGCGCNVDAQGSGAPPPPPPALPGGNDGGGCGCIVVAMVGGVEASLYTLARANLKSLELRVTSFGSYHRRLLHAVAAADAAAAAAPPLPPPGASSGGVATGLRHLCLRLMPTPHHGATVAGVGGSGLGGTFGGMPSASLSCGPLALGDAAAAPPTAVGWAQPSESEQMLAALPALHGLERLEVPELLLISSSQLTRLSVLTRLSELRVGGIVAAGVPASWAATAAAGGGRHGGGGAAILPQLRALTIEAESPTYSGGGAAVPWWAAACPALRRLSLTLQYGNATSTTLGGWRYDGQPATEQLAAALARVAEVRLVVCAAGKIASAAAVVTAGNGFGGRGSSGGGGGTLREYLPAILRRSRTVRHLELHAADPAELLACLSDDLLAAAPAAPCDDGCTSAGVESLQLNVPLGRWATGTSTPAAAAAAAETVTSLCGLLARLLARASPAPRCLCFSLPGLWGQPTAAGDHGDADDAAGWLGCAERRRRVEAAVAAVAVVAAGRGTRLCLCGLGLEERAGLLRCAERRGVVVAERRCPGCVLDRPVSPAYRVRCAS